VRPAWSPGPVRNPAKDLCKITRGSANGSNLSPRSSSYRRLADETMLPVKSILADAPKSSKAAQAAALS
jgi:hypothetical protein